MKNKVFYLFGLVVLTLAGLLLLVMLSLPASVLVNIFPARLMDTFEATMVLRLLLFPCVALLIAAMLLQSGLKLMQERQNAGAADVGGTLPPPNHAGSAALVTLTLSALLLAKAFHNLYWFMVWDSTYDPLEYIWLFFPILVVLFSVFMLVITLPGRTKLAGGLYGLLIPVLIVVSTYAQQVDFRQLTEEHAQRTRKVIETYYTREGRYPKDLRQLTPWTSLSLPVPFIIYGQDWCYDGRDQSYRLGYVYREHWSDPRLVGRIYETVGEMPNRDRICDEEIAALQERHPWMSHSDDYEY